MERSRAQAGPAAGGSGWEGAWYQGSPASLQTSAVNVGPLACVTRRPGPGCLTRLSSFIPVRSSCRNDSDAAGPCLRQRTRWTSTVVLRGAWFPVTSAGSQPGGPASLSLLPCSDTWAPLMTPGSLGSPRSAACNPPPHPAFFLPGRGTSQSDLMVPSPSLPEA